MFLPEGAVKYEPMKMEFVNFEKFIESLHQDLFTGYCEFKMDESIVLLFDEGNLQRTFRLEEGTSYLLLPGEAFGECTNPSGEIRGVVLPPKVVDMMIQLLFCKPVHENLSTQFTDFRNLLRSLEGDNFSGYVEIQIRGEVHYLTLEKGGPRSAFYFSENHLVEGAEALEGIFADEEIGGATINIYPLRDVPLQEVFLKLSKGFLTTYSELKGPILTQQLWKKLSSCAEGQVGIDDLEFNLEDLPTDLRKQEEILVPLLQCELGFFTEELGEKTVRTLYFKLLEGVESPLKELFGGVIT